MEKKTAVDSRPAAADLVMQATAAYLGGDSSLGVQLLGEALDALTSGTPAARAALLIQQSGWLRESGDGAGAAAAREAAAAELERLPRAGHESEWSALRMEEGVAARRRGDFPAAERLLREAADLAVLGPAPDHQLPDVLANLAAVYQDLGRLGDARDALDRALEIDRRVGDRRNESSDLNMMGLVQQQLGDPGTARVYFSRAFEMAVEHGLVREATNAMSNLASLMDDEGDHAGADALFREAGELLGSGGDRASEACSLANQGVAAASSGDLDRAAVLFTRSHELHVATGNLLHAVQDELNLSSLEGSRGRAQEALAHAQAALSAADGYGFVEMLWAAEYAVASCRVAALRGKGGAADPGPELEQALAGYRRSADAIELLRQGVDRPEEREALLSGKERVFDEAIELSLVLGRAHEAFAFCERARMRSFLDALGSDRLARLEAAVGADGSSSVATAHRDELVRRLLDPDTPAGEKPAVMAELRTARADLLALRPALAAVSEAELPGLEAVSAALPPDTCLLEFYQHGDRVIMFLVDETGLKDCGAVTFDEPLPVLVQRFRDEIEAAGPGLPTGHFLFAELFGPVMGFLRTTANLIVVPHKSLHYVPFAALWFVPAGDEAPPRQYLRSRFYLTVAPSASYLPYLARASAQSRDLAPAVVLADPTGDLEGAAEEGRLVAGRLGVRPVLGPDATRDRLLSAQAPRVLHVACHGSYHEEDPLLSGLRLADGIVTVEDLLTAGPAPALLVLSGCVTGLSKAKPGDELVGLAQSALRAGTRAVIATLWETFDETSALFFDQLYNALMEGESVSASVAWARQALVTGPGGFDQPVDWAPFVLIGDQELRVVGADETPRARLGQALTLVRSGDAEAAQPIFREVAEIVSDVAVVAQYSLAELLERAGDLVQAEAMYQRAAADGPGRWSGLALLSLGAMKLDSGDDEAARAAFRRAMASGDAEAEAKAAINLGNLLTADGDVEGARAAYQHAVDTGDPDVLPSAALELGSLLAQAGDEPGAEVAWQLAVDTKHPEIMPVASFNVGILQARRGATAEARLSFEAATHGQDPELVADAREALRSLDAPE